MKKQASITIHDIANELNISASTVSRALNNNPKISAATTKKIKETAKRLGYQPNVLASSLRSRKSNTIGIVVPLINRHFFSTFISGVEDYASNAGYNVIISQSKDLLDKEQQVVQSLVANRVDGVIISISMQTDTYDHIRLFPNNNIPIVFFDRVVPAFQANKIVVDDHNVGYEATQHLIDQGYKRIAHLAGPTVLHTYNDRMEGYKDALAANNLAYNESYVIYNRLTRIDATDAIKQLMALKEKPDAIFCGNDTTALSISAYMKSIGIHVPQEFGIIGFCDEPPTKLVSPSISTLKQPAYEMGVKAAELLIREIDEDLTEFETIKVPTTLIARESTMRN